jgi:hypothetical protein
MTRKLLARRVVDILHIDENGDILHAGVSQTDEVRNRGQHYSDTDEQQSVGHKIRKHDQRDSANQRNDRLLLFPVNEIPQAYGAEEQSP